MRVSVRGLYCLYVQGEAMERKLFSLCLCIFIAHMEGCGEHKCVCTTRLLENTKQDDPHVSCTSTVVYY